MFDSTMKKARNWKQVGINYFIQCQGEPTARMYNLPSLFVVIIH